MGRRVFSTLGLAGLIIAGLGGTASVWGQTEPGKVVAGANAPAGVGLLEEGPPRVLGGRGALSARGTKADQASRAIQPPIDTHAPWYTNGFLSLAVVIVLIGVIAWVVKRLAPRTRLGGSAVRILGRTYLSPKQSLALVRVGNRVALIGITPDHISHVMAVDDLATADSTLAGVGAETGSADQFNGFLEKETNFFGTEEALEEHVDSSDTRSVRRTRRSLTDLLGQVKKMKEATRS